MKLIVTTGTHPRHLYVLNLLIKNELVAGVIFQQREPMIGDVPEDLEKDIKILYENHFLLRNKMEEKYFGKIEPQDVIQDIPYIMLESNELNGKKAEDFIKKIQGDTLFTYGPTLIKDNILALYNDSFNLHGGLSPWYKGAATMFWPFYFLEPNYVGTTLHRITSKIDGGDIIHHSVPNIERGDCMHEVACKTIVEAGKDIVEIFKKIHEGKRVVGVPQKKNGKLFLQKDWRPEHLRLIYETFNDRIVDYYLDGIIGKGNEPELVRVSFL